MASSLATKYWAMRSGFEARQKVRQDFLDAHKLASAVLIGRAGQGNLPDFLPGKRVALVVEQDPNLAAKKGIAVLKG